MMTRIKGPLDARLRSSRAQHLFTQRYEVRRQTIGVASTGFTRADIRNGNPFAFQVIRDAQPWHTSGRGEPPW